MSLTTMCLKNLASAVGKMPPSLQEMVIKESRETIKEQVKDQARNEVRKEESEKLLDILPFLITDIMKDIIHTIVTPGALRKDYYQEYRHVDKSIILCAIQTSELATSAMNMEERYVHNAFNQRRPQMMCSDDESEDY